MDFTIRPGEPVAAEVRRVLAEQLDSAIAHLRDPGPAGPAEAVHEARKSCKRLRAVFRLVRPALGPGRYRTLDATVRDAARELSAARDAQALIAMFDDLLAAHGVDPADGEAAVVRRALVDRAEPADEEAGSGRALDRATERLELAREATARLPRRGGFDVVRKGITATYGAGHQALDRFRGEPSPTLSHEWRKAVKYTWHHVELLEDSAPLLLAPTARGLHDLSDALGDAHNLTVLVDLLRESPARFGGPATAERVAKMAEDSRADLEDRAVRLGLRLYAERPKAFGRRMEAYWKAARVGPELSTGELAAIAETDHADDR
jgi:CHAD domain-containing protein